MVARQGRSKLGDSSLAWKMLRNPMRLPRFARNDSSVDAHLFMTFTIAIPNSLPTGPGPDRGRGRQAQSEFRNLNTKVCFDHSGVVLNLLGFPFGNLLAVVKHEDPIAEFDDHIHIVLDDEEDLP